jgi:protein-S-isoprenylcysteine O-methyltransferase Ste14
MIIKQNPDTWKSILFVTMQFVCLGLIFISGPLIADPFYLLILELAGIALGIWAVLAMGWGNLNIAPDPLEWSKMVKFGPYRVIRHPMYLALLLTTFPLVLEKFTFIRLAVWLVLLLTLIFKMRYEEGMLQEKFPSYREYMDESSRLIPGIY